MSSNGIEIRDLQDENVALIESWPRDFPFPDLENFLYCTRKEVVWNGQVIAGLFLKLTSEVILIQDMNVPKSVRARCFEQGIEVVDQEMKKYGLDGTHAFVSGPNIGEAIAFFVTRLGFVPAGGFALYRRVSDEQEGREGDETSGGRVTDPVNRPDAS